MGNNNNIIIMGADFVFNILNILMICGIAIVTSSFS